MHLFSLPFELLHGIIHLLSYSELWTLSTTCRQGRRFAFELVHEKYNINLLRPVIINPYAHLVYGSLARLEQPEKMARFLTRAIYQRTPTTTDWSESMASLEFLLGTTVSIILNALPFLDFPIDALARLVHDLQYHLNLQFDLLPPMTRLLTDGLLQSPRPTTTTTMGLERSTAFVCRLITLDTLGITQARLFATHIMTQPSLDPEQAMRLLLDIVHATQLKTPQPGDHVHLTAMVRLLQDSFTAFHKFKLGGG